MLQVPQHQRRRGLLERYVRGGFRATFAVCLVLAGCQQDKKEEDTPVSVPPIDETAPQVLTRAEWLGSRFLDPLGKEASFVPEVLIAGGPQEPLSLTHSQVNAPVALFHGGGTGEGGVVSPVPFLAFRADAKAKVTIRHVKSVNGQNISSQVLLPVTCPEKFLASVPAEEGVLIHCLPLINATVPGFLVPTDNSGAYVHEFVISVKTGGLGATVLQTKIGSRIIIPNQTLSISATDDLKALTLSDRLTMATNDLIGSPRRDFRAFEIRGDIAPGVETEWILTFNDVKMVLEEEVFFEQPVVAGETPARPSVNRGAAFYKRSISVNSLDHFRLRALDGNTENAFYNLASGGSAFQIAMPVKDGTQPLRLFFTLDFGSEQATRSMSEYVRPFGPTFCARELAAFKPEEWRQSRLNPQYVACEAQTRQRIVDAADAAKKGVSSPIETYFGAFSYIPRLSGTVLGGMNGVLSLRMSLSGKIRVAVRNPHDLSTVTEVGSLNLAYTFQFPTVVSEMDRVIKAGRATPGMDTMLSAIQRKGIAELPRRGEGGKIPSFPFQGHEKDDVFH